MAEARPDARSQPRVWDAVHIDIQVTADAELSPALAVALEQFSQVVAAECASEAVQGYQQGAEVDAPEVAGFFPRVDAPLRYNVQYRRGARRVSGAVVR